MNNSILVLPISNVNQLKIILPTQHVNFFDTITIFLISNSEEITLYHGCASLALHDFFDRLQQILDNKLILHSSIKTDIGFLWNECLQNKLNDTFVFKFVEKISFWVGEDYLLWSMPHHIETWFYEKDGKYYLEVTPLYPWHFVDPKVEHEFYSYETFIKKYQPIAVIEIQKKQLQIWFSHIQKMLEIMIINQKNSDKHCV